MTLNEKLAQNILRDVQSGVPFKPYSETPPRSVESAYEIQDLLTGHYENPEVFGPVAGWKIAANSQALMERFKLKEPATGRVFSKQRKDSGVALTAADYSQFAFEPEIVAVMKDTLAVDKAPFTSDQVAAAIARFVPGIELLDMRQTDMPNTHIPDAIAQNISNAGAVTGGPGVPPGALDTAAIRTVLRINGEVQHDVTGAAPQDPLSAVTWLANHLAARGYALEAGQIVMCGTHSPIWYHEGTGEIEVSMSGLGSVTLTLG
ncbi:2-keto-4-pentenoate hydratase [Neptunicoccus sediminis]|uniref:2-keto-4-pentenoate hydratase n=1 Tax=Neptunicoccus sediminis TaxID=1892596 RepID=UPI000845FA59|nr:fumarylacetoacetate hydrolase family protein [Neptunicoccus sediminis]